uniref:Tudor domain-containing protein n=1 Tax=Ciona savignyi TaxID=51511 RepID=H2Z9R5_CIOSA
MSVPINVGWDDSALIQAYDDAVSNLKSLDTNFSTTGIQAHCNTYEDAPINDTGYVVWSRSSGIEVQHSTNDQDGDLNWEIGDECMAFFYEEELYYHAVVQSIDWENNTVTVEYTNYDGPHETVQLEDIHPRDLWNQHEKDSTLSETTQSDSNSTLKSPKLKSKKSKKPKSSHHRVQPNLASKDFQKNSTENPSSFLPPTPWMLPPHLGSMEKGGSLSKDALSNMFASWYMAGYQTGFYRGLASSCCKSNCKSDKKVNDKDGNI